MLGCLEYLGHFQCDLERSNVFWTPTGDVLELKTGYRPSFERERERERVLSLGLGDARLYIDGRAAKFEAACGRKASFSTWTYICGSLSSVCRAQVASSSSHRPRPVQLQTHLRLAQYADGTFPFVGSLSQLVVTAAALDREAVARLYAARGGGAFLDSRKL